MILYYNCRKVDQVEINLTDAEMEIMKLLWSQGQLKAGQISERLIEKKGWKKNTTYTLINRLIKKDAIERMEPGYICKPLLQEENVKLSETKSLLDRLYGGSFSMLVQNFIKEEKLSETEVEEIKRMIEESKS